MTANNDQNTTPEARPPAHDNRVPVCPDLDSIEEFMDCCINCFRGEDGRVRTSASRFTTAEMQKGLEEVLALEEESSVNTPGGLLAYCLRGAQWVDMHGEKARRVAQERQSDGSAENTDA